MAAVLLSVVFAFNFVSFGKIEFRFQMFFSAGAKARSSVWSHRCFPHVLFMCISLSASTFTHLLLPNKGVVILNKA